jgi:hypothetical protein
VIQIEQGRDGTYAVMCQGKPPTTVSSFDELVSYLRTEFAPADAPRPMPATSASTSRRHRAGVSARRED